MSTNKTFVLQDASLITALCGVHDVNLRYIEKLLNTPIYVKGNVIYLADPEAHVHQLFIQICTELVTYITKGWEINQDLIKMLYEIQSERKDRKHIFIHIPVIDTTIYPKTSGQRNLIRAMESSQLSIASGPAGTGKTYLAISYALACVFNKQVRRIVMTRPVVEAGENLGFLPGDFSQKIAPYLYPLFDVLSALLPPDLLERLEKQKVLEVLPLAYMRGRNLDNSFIILDEAQNVSREQMKMFLTRIGEGSIVVITGDPTQLDISRKESSLKQTIAMLAKVDGVSHVPLTVADVVRSSFVKKIVQLYDEQNS